VSGGILREQLSYDHPRRVAGLDAARAELKRLQRSVAAAYANRDVKAVRYLQRRVLRCAQAVRSLGGRVSLDE
jgi:hypothetical protein